MITSFPRYQKSIQGIIKFYNLEFQYEINFLRTIKKSCYGSQSLVVHEIIQKVIDTRKQSQCGRFESLSLY